LLIADLEAPQSPIIVKIIEPPKQTLYDVLFGALGLAGVLLLLSVIAAAALGGILFWVRRRGE
jgi:hypothetical protein